MDEWVFNFKATIQNVLPLVGVLLIIFGYIRHMPTLIGT